MIFSLDVRRARKGDCLLLHFGTKDDPGLVMIDGGPGQVYGPHLKPRIKEIRKARRLKDEEPLDVDLLMVSHVDDDHIHGILDLTRELIEADMARQPPMLQVLSFWHNSFDDIIGHKPEELTSSAKDHFGEAAVSGNGEISEDARLAVEENASEDDPEVINSSLKVLASIEQGYRLRINAERLEFSVNPEFDGKLIIAQEGQDSIDMGKGLTFKVAGPMLPELEALRRKHDEWLRDLKAKGKSPPEALAAYVDKSVPNLSSIVLLAEVDGARMLLTGDARGDRILKGLQLVGLLDPGEDSTIEVDLVKVPHHGSANNLDRDFFARIIAKHYVFSGDGEHGNPEREALEMLFDARGDEPFTVHLTYPIKEIDEGRKKDWEKEQGKEIKKRERKKTQAEKDKVKVRENWSPKKHSLAAFFDERGLAGGQEIRIVDAKKPHLIDLLDPLKF
jgi:hypothetical protein